MNTIMKKLNTIAKNKESFIVVCVLFKIRKRIKK